MNKYIKAKTITIIFISLNSNIWAFFLRLDAFLYIID